MPVCLMPSVVLPILPLLISVGVLILGNGLQGTLLPVRAQLEGFSTVAIGVLGSFYFLGFALGCVGVPYVIKRVGHIRTFAALAAVAASAPLVHAIFVAPVPWAVLRFLTGICFAGLYMVIESWLNEAASNERRGQVMSLYIVVNFAAITVGQTLIGLDDPRDFALFSLVGILAALALVPVALADTLGPRPPSTVRLRLLRLYRLSPVGVVGCFMIGFVNGAFWTLAPAYVSGIGYDTGTIAAFMAFAVVGGALAQWPLGRLSDRIDRRLVIIGGCLVASAAGAGLALAVASTPIVLACATVFGASALSMYALCVAHTNDFVDREDAVEVSSGLLLLFAAGAVAGPFLGSMAMASALGASGLFLTTAAGHLLLALFVAYRIRQRAAVALEAREPFVMVEPRATPAVYELDPRAVPTAEQAEADEATEPLPPDLREGDAPAPAEADSAAVGEGAERR